MDRRDFVKILTALSAGTATFSAWCKPDPNAPNVAPFEMHLVYDARVVDACALPDALLSRAARLYAFTGDVTPIWYDELHRLWQTRNNTTIGMTREAEFFVLSTLARDYGYDVWHRDEWFAYTTWMLAPAAGVYGRP